MGRKVLYIRFTKSVWQGTSNDWIPQRWAWRKNSNSIIYCSHALPLHPSIRMKKKSHPTENTTRATAAESQQQGWEPTTATSRSNIPRARSETIDPESICSKSFSHLQLFFPPGDRLGGGGLMLSCFLKGKRTGRKGNASIVFSKVWNSFLVAEKGSGGLLSCLLGFDRLQEMFSKGGERLEWSGSVSCFWQQPARCLSEHSLKADKQLFHQFVLRQALDTSKEVGGDANRSDGLIMALTSNKLTTFRLGFKTSSCHQAALYLDSLTSLRELGVCPTWRAKT